MRKSNETALTFFVCAACMHYIGEGFTWVTFVAGIFGCFVLGAASAAYFNLWDKDQ